MSAVVQLPSTRVRYMSRSDMPSVISIERDAYDFPWTEGIFRDCLRVGYSCWVYEEEKEILAYGVMSIAAGECHLLNLCVHPGAQGRGIGRLMLRRLLGIARHHGSDTILLEVRPSNHVAQRLYFAEGFNEVGTRPGYYPAKHGREDALVLAKAL